MENLHPTTGYTGKEPIEIVGIQQKNDLTDGLGR